MIQILFSLPSLEFDYETFTASARRETRPRIPDRWEYSGDVTLEHGGVFIDISTWDDGYCAAVRVTDLGSACGFDGAVLVEHVTINGTDNSERIREVVASCGNFDWCRNEERSRVPAMTKHALRLMIAEALLSYGYSDMDDSWDNYQSSHSETIQTDPTGEMSFDGWRADKRFEPDDDLFTYVVENHLQD